jgi:Tol biopolymer transport system component
MRTSHLISLTAPAAGAVDPNAATSKGGAAIRRVIAVVAVSALALLGLIAVASPAQGSIAPGTNGKIVFGQIEPNYGVTINPDGSDEHQIGPPSSTTCNTWSPDGSKVLCNVWREDGVQPATANPDGSDFKLLNPNLPLDLFCLSWSPDGARLLCHSEGMGSSADAGLYTVRSSDAGDLVRVSATPRKGFDNGYGYSPDGSRVLFARFDSSEKGTLFSVKPDGSGTLQITPPRLSVIDLGFFDRVGADWSPDESRVTFAAVQKRSTGRGFESAVFVVNADGTGLRRITPSGLFAASAQWSPNRAWIAFTGGRRVPEVWIVRPDGAGARKIALPLLDRLDRKAVEKLKRKLLRRCHKKSGNRERCKRKADQRAKKKAASQKLTPVWSPDSTKLLFQRLSPDGKVDLWTVNVDGTGLSKLAHARNPAPFGWLYAWGTAPLGGL